MAAQKGRDFVVKILSGGSYVSIGALRANSLTINNEVVNITTKGSGSWRELIEGAGIQSMSISGDGVFKGASEESTLRTQAMNNTLINYQLVSGNGDTFTGPFQVASYERSGDYNLEETFSITLESADTIVLSGV